MGSIITTIVYANILPAIALVILYFMIKHNHLFNKKQSMLFRFTVVMNFMLLIVISLDAIFSKMDVSYIWMFRRITSSINFIFSPVVPFVLYLIFLENRKPKLWYYIPITINAILCISSIFFKIVFEISEINKYFRGPLFFFPFAISLLYIVIIIFEVGDISKSGRKSERIFLCAVMAILMCFMGVEILGYYYFLTWDATVICLILYYLLISINNSNLDSLTGAYNRAMYMKELSLVEKSYSCSIALIDINEFKLINDTLGHHEGDNVLIHLANVLSKLSKGKANVYRIGGDEFTLISRDLSELDIKNILEQARIETNTHQYDFAYGTATYNCYLQQSLEKTIEVADNNMYTFKSQRKTLTNEKLFSI